MDQQEFFAAQQPTADELRRARGNAAQARTSGAFRARVLKLWNEQHDPIAAAAQALRSKILLAGRFWESDDQSKSRVYFTARVRGERQFDADGYYDLKANTWHADRNAVGLMTDAEFGSFVLKNIVGA